MASPQLRVLVVDVGGTKVKALASGVEEWRRFPSGRTLTPRRMVEGIEEIIKDWSYDVVTVGYPGDVVFGTVVSDPPNLAPGWIGFDFRAAFNRPTKLVNDAVLPALGCYRGGRM